MLDRFGYGNVHEELQGSATYGLGNILTLQSDVHAMFDNLPAGIGLRSVEEWAEKEILVEKIAYVFDNRMNKNAYTSVHNWFRKNRWVFDEDMSVPYPPE